ncbi:MAG TPA: hypothetical protein VM263_11480 [Acidimicrobiales bacterium]|nr:hypothetical protein [Acidimicrobiales bacterium]
MRRAGTTGPAVGILAAVVVVAIAVVGWIVVSDDGSDGPGGTGATETPEAPLSMGERARGPDACAFISPADIERAAGAGPVRLVQAQSPGGGPGCEWVVGAEQAPVQLELATAGGGPAPSPPGAGEPVQGPWAAATWNGAARSLHVDTSTVDFVVRVAGDDRDRAREVATQVALLVAERN